MADRILAECTPLAQLEGIGAMTTSVSTLQEQSQKTDAAFVPNYIRTQHRFLASNWESSPCKPCFSTASRVLWLSGPPASGRAPPACPGCCCAGSCRYHLVLLSTT